MARTFKTDIQTSALEADNADISIMFFLKKKEKEKTFVQIICKQIVCIH